MVGMDSFSSFASMGASASSGMRFLRALGCHSFSGMDRFGRAFCLLLGSFRRRHRWFLGRTRKTRRRFHGSRLGLDRIQRAAGRTLDRRCGWQDGRLVLHLQMCDLLLNLRLKLVGGAAELVHEFADLAGDLRQLLWPKDDEGQKEQEDRLRETHALHHTAPGGKAAMTPRAILETQTSQESHPEADSSLIR